MKSETCPRHSKIMQGENIQKDEIHNSTHSKHHTVRIDSTTHNSFQGEVNKHSIEKQQLKYILS
jgi:hypothetical protein